MQPAAMQVLDQSENFGSARLGQVLLLRIRGAPTVETLEKIAARAEELQGGSGKRICVVTVVITGGPRGGLGDAERRRAIELQQKMNACVCVGAQLVLERGFMAAIVRSIMNGINLVGRPPYPTQVFSEIDSGVRFIIEHSAREGLSVDALELKSAVEAMFAGA